MDRMEVYGKLAKKLLLEGSEERESRRQEDDALVARWKNQGLLDGLTDQRMRVRARILESQRAYMKHKLLREASSDADIQGFIGVAFPAVRRVLDKSMAEEFITVSPLKGPSGQVFYIDYKYSTNKAGVGGYIDTASSPYGASSGPSKDVPLSNLAEGAFYKFENQAYSRREIVTPAFTAGASNAFITGTVLSTATAAHLKRADYDPVAVAAMADSKLTEVRLKGLWLSQTSGATWNSAIAGANTIDKSVLQAWVPLSGSSTAESSGVPGVPVPFPSVKLLRHLTKVDGDDVCFYFSASTGAAATALSSVLTASMSVPIRTNVASVTGSDGAFSFAPAFESDFLSTTSIVIPEIEFDIRSKNIQTVTRKLKAKWTPEVAQDMDAFYSINAEESLTQLMTDHMAAEIQAEIFTKLLSGASAARYYWSRRPGFYVNKSTGAAASGSPDFTGNVQDWYRTLIETIFDVAAQIEKRTVLGEANFLVTSAEVAVILKNTLEWKAIEESQGVHRIGAVSAGTLQGRMKVYTNNHFPSNVILVGYKPEGSELEEMLGGGCVYCPYVPIILSPLMANPEDGTPRRMIMSRYATELLRGDFYGVVIVRDMDL